MLPYSDYKKSRLIFETFTLIKSGQATTKQEIAYLFDTNPENVENYINELNSEFNTGIRYDRNQMKYIVEQEGIMGLLKRNNPLTADDITIILYSLVNSQAFMETKMNIVKISLLGLLPIEEAQKLKNMFYFEKSNDPRELDIEFNLSKLRKGITEEKKMTFLYRRASGEQKQHKVIPYSFACELGKYYIIAKPDEEEKLVHYRIDRISSLRILDEEGKKQEKFNINDYMKRTWYMYGGKETKVVVKFALGCKTVVTERNMAVGRIVEENKDYFTYEFICNGTQGIRLWLMGFGAEAEVLEPMELREEIISDLMGMYKNYNLG
ncbi:helix-turn-helix transcriptional regulator [Clostridium estertheticum]|uniref:helix-turn-helix transcriptional regulator n=1 Tax=Clostridium estertheticum TaxID=238834 RepID=UPI001C7D37BC|nr:WYL domain-containing protein [Clostridium estertheticum]MBX4263123.1 WYL domain-containing protein [Clostridium estertheticum]WLC89436.1 WYL domain-containing protein [Clostridium estertheticum]